MPNLEASNRFAAPLSFRTSEPATVNPYGLDSQATGRIQGAQAIALPFQSDSSSGPTGNDFNGDGSSDLLWRNYRTGENALWYLNQGQYSSSSASTTIADANWEMVGTGDFNGDKQNDLVWRNKASGENVVWYLNGGQYQSSNHLTTVSDINWTGNTVRRDE